MAVNCNVYVLGVIVGRDLYCNIFDSQQREPINCRVSSTLKY